MCGTFAQVFAKRREPQTRHRKPFAIGKSPSKSLLGDFPMAKLSKPPQKPKPATPTPSTFLSPGRGAQGQTRLCCASSKRQGRLLLHPAPPTTTLTPKQVSSSSHILFQRLPQSLAGHPVPRLQETTREVRNFFSHAFPSNYIPSILIPLDPNTFHIRRPPSGGHWRVRLSSKCSRKPEGPKPVIASHLPLENPLVSPY